MIVAVLLLSVLFGSYLFYLIFFWKWKKNCQPMFNSEKPIVFGHRGSPNLVIENTIPSFQKAIDQGVDGLEFDIRLSKDKQIVVFHDASLKRLSDRSEAVSELSLTELQSIPLHKKEGQTEDAYIPSLNDVSLLIHQVRLRICLDIRLKYLWIQSDNQLMNI